VVTNQH